MSLHFFLDVAAAVTAAPGAQADLGAQALGALATYGIPGAIVFLAGAGIKAFEAWQERRRDPGPDRPVVVAIAEETVRVAIETASRTRLDAIEERLCQIEQRHADEDHDREIAEAEARGEARARASGDVAVVVDPPDSTSGRKRPR